MSSERFWFGGDRRVAGARGRGAGGCRGHRPGRRGRSAPRDALEAEVDVPVVRTDVWAWPASCCEGRFVTSRSVRPHCRSSATNRAVRPKRRRGAGTRAGCCRGCGGCRRRPGRGSDRTRAVEAEKQPDGAVPQPSVRRPSTGRESRRRRSRVALPAGLAERRARRQIDHAVRLLAVLGRDAAVDDSMSWAIAGSSEFEKVTPVWSPIGWPSITRSCWEWPPWKW